MGWRKKTCWWLGNFPVHGHLCQLQLGLLCCRDQGVMHYVPGRLHEGDPELGRVSEVEVCLAASTGWIQCAGLQILMINISFSSKALLDISSSVSQDLIYWIADHFCNSKNLQISSHFSCCSENFIISGQRPRQHHLSSEPLVGACNVRLNCLRKTECGVEVCVHI